ncbi:MAG: flagellar biosynthetic protein FliO [Lachnospiraceae bacterium]|nr:flagellar biosynthetic protein FliO [Lachnospiraceae bacterium]
MFATLVERADDQGVAESMEKAGSFAELISLLIIFVVVLALVLWVTRLMAKYQKGNKAAGNIDVVETSPIGNGKYIQIVKLADTYVALAVCKDTVTKLAEIPKEQIVFPEDGGNTSMSFKELLQRAKTTYPGKEDTKVEDSLKEE